MATRVFNAPSPAAQALLRVFVQFATAANAVLNGDNTDVVEVAQYDAVSVQATGTPGAGFTMIVEGSHDGVNFFPLRNNAGTALSIAATPGGDCLAYESRGARYARARVTAGDGTTAVTVSFMCTK